MPQIDLSILNQRQTPAFFADTLANRPAAGFVGRIFVSTDTLDLYRDNGTTWDLLSPSSTGTITGSGASGQVTYFSAASSITGSNNLFWDTANSRLGINTNTPGASIDVHSAISSIGQFNQTVATNNSLLVLQNNGTALWRLGSYYNAGANDFGIFDVIGAIQPVTIKKTSGQVLIGTSTVGSGKLVVASASSDNGVQIVGASAPSLRIDSAESGPTKRAGLGISTATNNFIQGSADRDFCIFNGSTAAASPILFGVYDAGAANVQEAARISAARNFIVGKVADSGQKLQIEGTSLLNGSLDITNYSNKSIVISSGTITAASDLLINNTTATYTGTAAVTHSGLISNPSVSVSGGSIQVVDVTGSYLAPIITSTATNSRVRVRGINIDTTRYSANDLSTAANNQTIGANIIIGTSSTYPLTSRSAHTGINITGTFASGVPSTLTGISSNLVMNTAGTGSSTLSGFNNNVQVTQGTSSILIGIDTTINNLGTDTATYGQRISFNGSYTNTMYGLYLGTAASPSANYWGLYIDDINAKNYLSSKLLIGTTTDSGQKLQVSGNALIAASSGTVATFQSTTQTQINIVATTSTSDIGLRIDANSQAWSVGMNFFAGAGGKDFNIFNGTSAQIPFKIYAATGGVNMRNLPTSSAGLASGDLWNNAGVVNIIP